MNKWRSWKSKWKIDEKKKSTTKAVKYVSLCKTEPVSSCEAQVCKVSASAQVTPDASEIVLEIFSPEASDAGPKQNWINRLKI